MEVPKAMFIQDEDAQGNPITVVTTTPDLRSTEEFADAIYKHNNKQPTPGFLILPDASRQAAVQRGYQSINEPLQRIAPQVGKAAGELNPIALMFNLAAKARMVPQGVSQAVTDVSGTVGEATGRMAAEQVNTLPKAGMAGATAIAAPAMLPAKLGTGAISGLGRLAVNTVGAGLAGTIGAEGARIAGGQEAEITPQQSLQDFAIAAAGGSAQTLIGHFLTRFMNRDIGEKVASQMVNHFKSRNPAIGLQDNIPAIATSSKQKVVDLVQMGSKGLRESLEKDTDDLLAAIKGTLPGALPAQQSVNYQNTLRAGIRKVIRAQNEQLDNIDNAKLFTQAGTEVQSAITELGDSVRGFIYQRSQPRPGQPKPPPMSMEASALRVETLLQNFNQQTQRYRDGAQVLHYMREANTASGLDFQALADMLRGVYGRSPGSSTQAIGKILGQGRELTEMPLTKQAAPADAFVGKVGSLLKQIPGVERFMSLATGMGTKQTPWLTQQPSAAIRPLINISAQEAGQKAMRDFLERKEQ